MNAPSYLDIVNLRQRVHDLRADIAGADDRIRRIEEALKPRRLALARLEAALAEAEAAPVRTVDE